MGMSNDFEVAIEEGADLVRIGTALLHNGLKRQKKSRFRRRQHGRGHDPRLLKPA